MKFFLGIVFIIFVSFSCIRNLEADLINAVPSKFVMTPEIKANNLSSSVANNSPEQLSIDQIINNLDESFAALDDYSATFVWTSEKKSDNVTHFFIKYGKMIKQVSEYQGKIIGSESVKILEDGIRKSAWHPEKYVIYKTLIHDSPEPSDFLQGFSNPAGMINSFKNDITNKAKYSITATNQEGTDTIIVTFDDTINQPPHKSAVYIRKSDWMLTKYVFTVGSENSEIYEWKDIRINQGLADSFFDLEYPKDAKVIEQVFPNRWVHVNNDDETIKPITYTDSKSGILITVESDGRHVSAKKSGITLWRKDPFVDGKLEPYRYTKPVISFVGKGNQEGYCSISFNSSQSGQVNLLTGHFEFGGQN